MPTPARTLRPDLNSNKHNPLGVVVSAASSIFGGRMRYGQCGLHFESLLALDMMKATEVRRDEAAETLPLSLVRS